MHFCMFDESAAGAVPQGGEGGRVSAAEVMQFDGRREAVASQATDGSPRVADLRRA